MRLGKRPAHPFYRLQRFPSLNFRRLEPIQQQRLQTQRYSSRGNQRRLKCCQEWNEGRRFDIVCHFSAVFSVRFCYYSGGSYSNRLPQSEFVPGTLERQFSRSKRFILRGRNQSSLLRRFRLMDNRQCSVCGAKWIGSQLYWSTGRQGKDADLNALVCRRLDGVKKENCANPAKGQDGGIGWEERAAMTEAALSEFDL